MLIPENIPRQVQLIQGRMQKRIQRLDIQRWFRGRYKGESSCSTYNVDSRAEFRASSAAKRSVLIPGQFLRQIQFLWQNLRRFPGSRRREFSYSTFSIDSSEDFKRSSATWRSISIPGRISRRTQLINILSTAEFKAWSATQHSMLIPLEPKVKFSYLAFNVDSWVSFKAIKANSARCFLPWV